MEAPRWAGKMQKDYPFTLDPFQSTAIACIERRESVLVAAHTSGERGAAGVGGWPMLQAPGAAARRHLQLWPVQ